MFIAFFTPHKLGFDIEDICNFSVKDWMGKGDDRPFFQLIGTISLKIALKISAFIVVPSSNFIKQLNGVNPIEVIGGCMDVPAMPPRLPPVNGVLKVLYSGTINRENGIHILLESLYLLDAQPELAARLSIHICGEGEGISELLARCEGLKHIRWTYHGLVPREAYLKLLESTHVCLALQDPAGRHATLKTPSKVYEYLAAGKAVILTPVGDLGKVPPDARVMLTPYTADALAEALDTLSSGFDAQMGVRAWTFAKDTYSLQTCGAKLQALIEASMPPPIGPEPA